MKILKAGMFSFLFFFLMLNANLFAQISVDRVFPDSTKGFFAISNVEELRKAWNQTEFSKMVNDPMFDGFRESLRAQVEEAWTQRFGMKLSDVVTLPSGELGGGFIAIPGKKPGFALVMDVTNHQELVNQFLVEIIRKTTSTKKGKATVERLSIGGKNVEATVLTFPADVKIPFERTAYYVNLDTILIVTDQKYLAELILTRLAGQTQQALVDLPAYREVLQRCVSDSATPTMPQIRYFLNPLEFGEGIRSISVLTEEEKNMTSPFNILAKQGFDGVQGIGGTLDWMADSYEFVWKTKIYVPEPPKRSLKMLSFLNVPNTTPPTWVADTTARCAYLYFDPLTLFNNVGPLFDEFLETEGVWDDILNSLEKDINGPQVNLRTELIGHFGTQLTVMTIYGQDASQNGGKFILSLDIKPGKDQEVAQALHRMFDTDPEFAQSPFGTDVLWQYVPQSGGSKNSSRPTSSARKARPTSAKVEPGDEELLKKGAFGVASGYLFISNDKSYLSEVIQNANEGKIKPFYENPHYQNIKAIIDQSTQNTGHFVDGYIDNLEGIRINYELFRSGKLRDSSLLSARLLRLILNSPDQTAELPFKLDTSKLPPFDDFQNKIGTSGYYGIVEPDGWYFKGFSLKSEK